MLYEVRVSKEYKRAYKKISEKDSVLIDNVVEKLSKDEPLEAKYKDHQLTQMLPPKLKKTQP